MKVAITADLHLTTPQKHPERFHALEDILEKISNSGINTLIIAGDLFDESSRNYSDFDQICRNASNIEILIIPGNHDSVLDHTSITAENVQFMTQPILKPFGELQFLFLPYEKDKTMGEFIAYHSSELIENKWVLIGHGDWTGGIHERNPFEPGVYMPLTRIDVESFKPAKVILGHIHKPMDAGKVYYTGSPCGIDISETGRRRFFVFDTETQLLESIQVDTDVIYFNESFVILPLKDETDYIKKQISKRVNGWGIREHEFSKVKLQVKIYGYSTNKKMLMQTIKAAFQAFVFHNDAGPDLSMVSVADDLNRAEIANRVSAWIERFDWNSAQTQPAKDQILLQALRVIYGD